MENTKLSPNKQKKQAAVAKIVEKIGKSKAVVLTNYQGLTHQQLEKFKRGIREADAEFVVTKNTLLKRALEESKMETGETSNFDQQTGTLFLYGDPVTPLKALAKMIKEIEKPQIKYGILEGKGISKEQVMKLATLPSREVLIAQLLGMMKTPISGLHRSLSWNLTKFAMTLKAIEVKKAS